MKTFAAGSFLLFLAVANATTPVDRVISLLTKLSAQVQAEGIAEAASYDKYACFCKDTANDKVYVIAKSDKKIGELDAAITSLDAEIKSLDADVSKQKGVVKKEEQTKADNLKKRNGENKAYRKKRADLADAVDAVTGALETMQNSKKDVDEELSSLLQKLPSQSLSGPALSLIADATAGKRYGAPPGEAHQYQYASKEVIATLQDLMSTFKKELADLDEAEIGDQSTFEMARGARSNTITAMEKEINEKETLSASKGEEKSEKEEEKSEETGARNADQAFLDDLTSKCNAKAKAWDQRSTTRASELTALTQGVELLKGMGDTYNANAKLVGLVATGSKAPIAKHTQPVFLQLRSIQRVSAEETLSKLTSMLNKQAAASSSGALAMLALQIETAGPDHFVKVRGIIKDLISKLKADAKAEATSKGVCDKNMAAAIDKRDKNAAAMETANAQIDTTTSAINGLKDDIAELAEQVAALNKDLLEAEKLRKGEKADNEKTLADAGTGKKAVDQAVVILNKFYSSQLQVGKQTPNIANREGKTVGDMAPETFASDDVYKGNQGASTGIVGMLEVISSDFAGTIKTVTQAEKDAVKDYDQIKTDTEKSITDKEKLKKTKETDVESKESDLTGFKDDLKDATKMNEQALEELDKLKASCVDGTETYAERVAHRKEEIEALKQALEILDNWDQ